MFSARHFGKRVQHPFFLFRPASPFSVDSDAIFCHYSSNGSLLRQIVEGFHRKGRQPEQVSIDELAAVDEFHIGGVPTALNLFAQIEITPRDLVLDVGCGLGGPARVCALTRECNVVGIDLMSEYVDVGNILSSWPNVTMRDRVELRVCDATKDLNMAGINDASIDNAYMLHVGMNIDDKLSLARTVFRALKPGGRFASFDLMIPSTPRIPLEFPLPFATDIGSSALASSEEYKSKFSEVGFVLKKETDKLKIVTESVAEALQKLEKYALRNNGERPPLSLAVVMGPAFEQKLRNCLSLFRGGGMTATELVWEKPIEK